MALRGLADHLLTVEESASMHGENRQRRWIERLLWLAAPVLIAALVLALSRPLSLLLGPATVPYQMIAAGLVLCFAGLVTDAVTIWRRGPFASRWLLVGSVLTFGGFFLVVTGFCLSLNPPNPWVWLVPLMVFFGVLGYTRAGGVIPLRARGFVFWVLGTSLIVFVALVVQLVAAR